MTSRPYAIHRMELGPMQNFVYLIVDRASRRAAVVDPAWEVPRVLALAGELGTAITDILLTHSHHDHINGIEGVLRHHDAQLHLSKAEARFWDRYLDLPTLHHGGDRIRLGETEIQVLLTPGHTPGSACYQVGNDLVTGDTLFVFGCGRCDLAGGDPEQMYHTLRGLAEGLPPEMAVHPGHNYAVTPVSTMDEQIQGNPFLHFHRPADFVDYRMRRHNRRTPYTAVPPG